MFSVVEKRRAEDSAKDDSADSADNRPYYAADAGRIAAVFAVVIVGFVFIFVVIFVLAVLDRKSVV